jgi:glucose/arabinose dehydrogenase
VACQALVLMLAACGGGDGGSPMPSPPPPPPPPPADTTPPTVPGGLAATAQSASQINLTWTASTDAGTGVAGYRVFRDAGATAIATVTTTNYNDTNLSAATTYSYTVRAFDAATPANESAASAAASATTSAGPPPPPVALTTQRVFPNLPNFTQPIAMLQEPGVAARWYVVQKTGSGRVFDNTANVSTSREFVNVASLLNSDPSNANDERGLLGMAFHPNYPTNPRVYLFYTGNETGLGLVDRVSEFRTLDGGQTLSLGTELELFNVDDPEGNHNGGNIVFGPDGFLYIGIGDGGGGGDAHGSIGNGQLLTTLLGKMLRIDVSASTAGQTYAIPPDNPYAGNARCNANGSGAANCPEIYAFGLRNPWRWSFDRTSGELWLNDVGQGALEEVDRITRGGNYGWRCFEGTNPYSGTCGPNSGNAIAPIAQYGRGAGQSTTGGFVYRGSAIPALQGRYVFGDFASGNLWNIARDTTPTLTLDSSTAAATGLNIASFAQDTDGELYIVHLGGTLHRIIAQ